MDGIYTADSVTFGIDDTIRGTTFRANTGARPIITKADGYPPAISIKNKTTVSGIWFGGTKYSSEVGSIITVKENSTIENCTFWGYSQCIGGGSGYGSLYTKNRFVNCGFGTLYHDIYISNSTTIPLNDVISENIHIGGDGYKIHLYHDPHGCTVHANFTASLTPFSNGDIAIQHDNHTVTNNILWGGVKVSYFNGGSNTFDKNIIGPNRAEFPDYVTQWNTASGNVFCNGQTTWGASPQVWDAAAIATNLGKTKAQIDTAVSNLITKFGQTTAQIYADATIEDDFAVIRSVIDKWKVT